MLLMPRVTDQDRRGVQLRRFSYEPVPGRPGRHEHVRPRDEARRRKRECLDALVCTCGVLATSRVPRCTCAVLAIRSQCMVHGICNVLARGNDRSLHTPQPLVFSSRRGGRSRGLPSWSTRQACRRRMLRSGSQRAASMTLPKLLPSHAFDSSDWR